MQEGIIINFEIINSIQIIKRREVFHGQLKIPEDLLHIVVWFPMISINLLSGPKTIVKTLSVFVECVSLKVLKILGHFPTHMPLGSPLTLVPSILTMNGVSCPAAFLESTACLGKPTSNAPPFAPGLTARSTLFLEGSANIPTSEPSSILYLIGTVFPFIVRLYWLVNPGTKRVPIIRLLTSSPLGPPICTATCA